MFSKKWGRGETRPYHFFTSSSRFETCSTWRYLAWWSGQMDEENLSDNLVYIGTSGWSYKAWEKRFYPANLTRNRAYQTTGQPRRGAR